MKISHTIIKASTFLSVLFILFFSNLGLGKIDSSVDNKIALTESDDTQLDGKLSKEIKQEADQMWEEFEEVQDPNSWPRTEETKAIIKFNLFPLIIVIIVLVTGLTIYFLRRRKKNITNSD